MAENKTTMELEHSTSDKSGFFSVRGQSHSGSVSQESEDDYQSVSSSKEKSGFISVRGQSHFGSVSQEPEDYQSVFSRDVSSVMRRWDKETPIDDPLCESQCVSASITDMCSLCASKGIGIIATHICRGCSQYGRYFCQSCWDYHNRFLPTHDTLSLSVSSERLSKLMGDKLSNNNPDIVDLSDDFRPTNLAEKYQELYDNQWTDALEKAEEFFLNEKEKTRITVLYKILQNVYQFCKDEVVKQDSDFMTAMFRSHQTKELSSAIPESIQTKIKELKRYAVSKSTENLLKKYLKNCDKTNKIGQFAENSRDFVNECVNLCWHMVNQNHPVVLHLGVNSDDKFDGNMYKHYTMTGTVVDFVVWPALLLCENGSVLSKGVVQCAKLPQGSKSMRTRSKKVNATEMGVQTGSLKLTNTMAEVNVADLPQNMSRKATPKSPSELNQMEQPRKTTKPEKVHRKISVKLALPTDKTEDSVQHEQSHHSHLKTDNKQVNSSPDRMITKSQCHDKSQIPHELSSKQPNDGVDKYKQTLSEDINQNESASDYVQQYQQHDDCSKQSQSNTANIHQSQSYASDVMHTNPNNICNKYPNNDNNNQQYGEQFQQYQSNTGISRQQHQQQHQQQHHQQHQQHQQQQQQQQPQQQLPQCQPQQQQLQNISSLQSNAGIGQNSVTQSSGQATYGSQHQQPWISTYPTQQEYDFFIRYLNCVNPPDLKMNMGAQAYDRCMAYFLRKIESD